MPIQLSNHRIKSRSENRIPRTQLLTHTQPLRTLTGKHENRLAPRHRHTTSHPNTRTALNHLSQPRQQLITARTDHHRPMLKQRPRRHQRIPNIPRIKLPTSPHKLQQPPRLSTHTRRRPRRHHPRQHTRTHLNNPLNSLLNNNMRIRATKTE